MSDYKKEFALECPMCLSVFVTRAGSSVSVSEHSLSFDATCFDCGADVVCWVDFKEDEIVINTRGE
jgi:hypothetical protein